jgi:hypothetical protein
MGEIIDRDEEHLRLLPIGYYVMAGLTAFITLFSLLYIGLGVLFVSGLIPAKSDAVDDPRFAGFLFVVIGIAMFLFGASAAVMSYLAGRYLKLRTHRRFCLVVAGLSCVQIPWGTALGVLTFIVLNRASVRAMFDRREAVAPDGGPTQLNAS